jgi:hypothetical protein
MRVLEMYFLPTLFFAFVFSLFTITVYSSQNSTCFIYKQITLLLFHCCN